MARIASLMVCVASLAATGCSKGATTSWRSGQTHRTLAPSAFSEQAVRATEKFGPTTVSIADLRPGMDAQFSNPVYSGTYDASAGTGWIVLILATASGSVPSGVTWSTDATKTYFVDQTSLKPPSEAPPLSEERWTEVNFSSIGDAARANGLYTYESLIANPAIWLDLLEGSGAPVGTGRPSTLGTAPTTVYNLYLDLPSAASHVRGPGGRAISWLSQYIGITTIPAQVWLASDGSIAQIRLWRIQSNLPGLGSAGRPPTRAEMAAAETFTMTLGEGSAPSATANPQTPLGGTPPGASVAVLGEGRFRKCLAAGSSGMNAAIVARPSQHITGRIDATGCEIGIYVGPGTGKVVIDHVRVTGASDHALMIEDTKGTTVSNSSFSVVQVAILSHAVIPEDKAIALVGTSAAHLSNNNVTGELDGGIAVLDDGIVDAAAINSGQSRPGKANVLDGNSLIGGVGGCAVVLAAFDPGEGVIGNTFSRNRVIDSSPGGIILATDAPNTEASYNLIDSNTVINARLPGVLLHSNTPGDIMKGNRVTGNSLTNTGADRSGGLSVTAGILILGNHAPIDSTEVARNVISGVQDGVVLAGELATQLSGNTFSLLPGGAETAQIQPIGPPTSVPPPPDLGTG